MNGLELIDRYYAHYGNAAFTKHQVASYDRFVTSQMRGIIAAFNPISISVANNLTVWIGGRAGDEVFVGPPNAGPQQCRRDDLTYHCPVTANLTFAYDMISADGKRQPTEKRILGMPLFDLPVMVRSVLCDLRGKSRDAVREAGEDPLDPGSYFIVGGLEKIIVSQEDNAANRLFVSASSSDAAFTHTATLRSVADQGQGDDPTAVLFPRGLKFQVYSSSYRGGARRNAITVSIPALRESVPLFVMFRALGVVSDRDIVQHIVGDDVDGAHNVDLLEFLHHSVVDGNFLYTQDEALEYLRRLQRDTLTPVDPEQRFDIVLLLLGTDLFPMRRDLRGKALLLGDAAGTLVRTCLGALPPLARDNLRYKRVNVGGALIHDLFRDLYTFYHHTARNKLESTYLYNFKGQSVDNLITPTSLSRVFDAAILSGNFVASLKGSWRVLKSPSEFGTPLLGVCQDLARVTYMGTMSHMRRVNTPMEDSAASMVEPHRLQSSHWGMMCPSESPDGGSIGLLKHLAILAHVSPNGGYAGVLQLLGDRVSPPGAGAAHTGVRVRINGLWVGSCSDPGRLVEWVRLHRRNGLISPFVSVLWNVLSREVLINLDAGRCCRPLLVVGDGNKAPDPTALRGKRWLDLLRGSTIPAEAAADWDPETVSGYTPASTYLKLDDDDERVLEALRANQSPMEFLDAEESEGCLIASCVEDLAPSAAGLKRYTHLEIHASTLLSTVMNLIPMPNFTGAARNGMSCSQSKQGVGVYASNYLKRMDNMAYVLHYPQRALVTTRHAVHQNQDVLGHGENLIVAVLAYTGYNQEDAVIINKTSVERGLLDMTYYTTLKQREEQDRSGSTRVQFGHPDRMREQGMDLGESSSKRRREAMAALDDRGFPRPGSTLHEGDVVVGKVATIVSMVKDPKWEQTVRKIEHSDQSLVADKVIEGTVDLVHVFQHDAKNRLSTCKVRLRKARPPAVGDKLSSRYSQKGCIAILLPAEDMPFAKDGQIPDLIINPGGFPKRMTVSQLLETILGTLGAALGSQIDATAFEPLDIEKCCDVLEKRCGMNRFGERVLYNGWNGAQMPANVLVSPIYQQRLKHMSVDKLNYRRTGGSQALTHQPNQGRSAGGGLRIGEMECFSCYGHGVHGFLNESYMTRSDGEVFGLDAEGHVTSATDPSRSSTVRMPFCFKLMSQELQAMGIGMELQTAPPAESDDDDDDEVDDDDDDEA